jgi:DNA topoisomerase-1
LYDLIWKRAIASQMADAELERTTATISISGNPSTFTATGEVIKFEGFLKVYMESKDDDDAEDEESGKVLPPLNVGQKLDLNKISATQTFSRHPARYTEASLVKKLEELRHWPTIHLCTNNFYRAKARLCSERKSRRCGAPVQRAHA